LASLPAFQYFSRTHLGYVAPFLLLAWLAIWRDKWQWAGFCFSLAILAHFNAVLAVGLSCCSLGLFYFRPRYWRKWFDFVVAGLLPIISVEFLFFIYYGQVFQWTRGTLGVGLRWSGTSGSSAVNVSAPNLLWLPQVMVGSNGWLLSAVLLLSIFAIAIYRKDKYGFTLNLTFLSAIFGYVIIAVMRGDFVSRALAPYYPFGSVGAATVLWWAVARITSIRLRGAVYVIILASLTMLFVSSLVFIRGFTQTLHPQIEQWIIRAANEKRSVRHLGNPWIPLFYADIHGVEFVSGYDGWIERNQPGQSILIFESTTPSSWKPIGYYLETIEMPSYYDSLYPVLTSESNISRRFEVWWPTQTPQIVEPQGDLPIGRVAIHYSGKGCVTPPPFGNGTLYYYQLAWKRLGERLGIR
jgi:hypothetical protein